MTIVKWEGDEQRLGSGGLSEAEGFVFEMSNTKEHLQIN